MFATLAGTYPQPHGDDEDGLHAVLAIQAEAGLGMLSDGRVHDEAADTLAGSWLRTRRAADDLGIEVPVKLAVAGPWARSIARSRRGPAEAQARGLRRALEGLAAGGCPVIEIHEAATTLPADDDGVRRFVAAHATMLEGLRPGIHATLAITGGEAGSAGAAALAGLPYHSCLLDLLDGPEGWRLIVDLPAERGMILGIGDASGRGRAGLETIAWAAQYAASTQGRGLARIGIAPSGGLDAMAAGQARELIGLLGEAARLLTGDTEVLLRRMDPRAIDIRSAALGEYRPDPRARPGG